MTSHFRSWIKAHTSFQAGIGGQVSDPWGRAPCPARAPGPRTDVVVVQMHVKECELLQLRQGRAQALSACIASEALELHGQGTGPRAVGQNRGKGW